MGLSTGGGFRYGHVLICTWFFSNWPSLATSWKAITFRADMAPCSLMEVSLSNFDAAFCGPVANGVGPASSFAHDILPGGRCVANLWGAPFQDFVSAFPASRQDLKLRPVKVSFCHNFGFFAHSLADYALLRRTTLAVWQPLSKLPKASVGNGSCFTVAM